MKENLEVMNTSSTELVINRISDATNPQTVCLAVYLVYSIKTSYININGGHLTICTFSKQPLKLHTL